MWGCGLVVVENWMWGWVVEGDRFGGGERRREGIEKRRL